MNLLPDFDQLDILNGDERVELADCESVIERGLETFVEVGQALLRIRDNRLYRESGTFEEYCQERWQMERRHAYRLMDAASVVENVSNWTQTAPANEAQARPLTELEPEAQRLAWEIVKETAPEGKVTAAHVKSVVTVLKEVLITGAIDDGEGMSISIQEATSTHVKAAVTEETYERMRRHEAHIATGIENGKHKPKMNRGGDIYEPEGSDACQTPPEGLQPLLPYVNPEWEIWEPAQGQGLLVAAMRESGLHVVYSGDRETGQNFFEYEPEEWDCIITNPPYSIKYDWLERCYELGKPFALLMPVEMLGAKTAQALFRQYGIEVVFPNGRLNFSMPNIGFEGSAAQFPTAWFTWRLNIGQGMTFSELPR